MTEYVVMLQGDPTIWLGGETPGRVEGHRAHGVFARACEDAGHAILAGAELHHTHATVVRVVGDLVTVTDGPYTEATEVVAGFYRIATDDLDGLARLVGELIKVTGETAVLRETIPAPVGV
jgi:hypothetical protein